MTITAGLGRRSPTSTAPPSTAGTSTSTGTPRPPRRAATRASWPRRSTSSRTRSPTPCSAAPTPPAGSCSTSCGSTRRCSGASTRSSSSPAGRPPTPARSRSTRSSTGAGSPSRSSFAHEFRYRDPVVNEKTLVVAISQSGETMDTIMAVRHAREQGARVIAICNTNGSTIPRESDGVALHPRRPGDRGRVDQGVPRPDHGLLPARALPGPAARHEVRRRGRTRCSASCTPCRTRSRRCSTGSSRCGRWPAGWPTPARCSSSGRHVGYPVAMEGALKLKELAYIHAEGFAAGELKHGPIALIEAGQPVFVIVPVAARPRLAAQQGRLEHPGDQRPRGPDDRHRRGGRRRGRARTPPR